MGKSHGCGYLLCILLALFFSCVLHPYPGWAAVSDGFDYPVGNPANASPHWKTQDFLAPDGFWYDGTYYIGHLGEDWSGSMSTSTAIKSTSNGQVVRVTTDSWGGGWGWACIVRHDLPGGGVIYSQYAHMSRLDASQSQWVNKGQQLGLAGTTGNSSGVHLHFAMKNTGAAFGPAYTFQTPPVGANEITYSGAVYYRPSWYVNNHRILCTSPGVPNLTQPNEWQSFSLGSNPNLHADNTSGTTPQTTHFWVDGGPDSGFISANDWQPGVLGSGDYTWNAQKRNGCDTSVAATRHFHINYPPNTPSLASPADGAILSSRNVPLAWNGAADPDGGPGAVRYCVNRNNWGGETGWIGTATSTSLTAPSDGAFTWQVKAADDWNESGYSGTRSFTVDTTGPSISLSAPATSTWFKTPQSVGWTITDATSGFASATLRWDTGATSGVAASGSAQIPEGRHSVTMSATDVAGNTSSQTAGPFWVDLMAPVVSLSATPTAPDGEDGWYVTPPLLAVGATDPNGTEGSGVAGVFYALDGGPEAPYISPIALSGDGEHTVFGRAEDVAGNSGSTEAIVKLDTTPPDMGAVTVDSISGRLDRLVASWEADDLHSGIGECEYWIGTTAGEDDVRTATGTGEDNWAYTVNLDLAADQTYYFTVRAKNVAGLWSDPVSSAGVTVTPSYYDFAPDFNSGGVAVPTEARISTNYMLVDAIGQFVVAESGSANFVVEHGYWHSEFNPTVAATVGAAKAYADGVTLQLGDETRPVVVTAAPGVFADRFYVEQPDKTSGIAVQYGAVGGPTLIEGDRVWVIGKTATLSGERLLQFATTHYVDHIDPLGPLAIAAPRLGGGPLGLYTPGVLDGEGLNNVGLLVQVYGGVVSYRDTQGRFFYLDSGDGLYDGFGYGIRIICDGLAGGAKLSMPGYGKLVVVTGISSTAIVNDQAVRAIRPRRQGDIQEIN